MLIKLLTALLFASASVSSFASPVFNASNGHYYELHTFTDNWRLNWSEAEAFAENLTYQGGRGYLATITSQEEDNFLWNVLGAQGSYLGAFDVSSFDSNLGQWQHQAWQWVTGETFSYTNWLPGEPNNWHDSSPLTADNEDYLMYWWQADANGGTWNDTNLDSSYLSDTGITYTTRGFVVEYTPAFASPVPLPHSIWLFASGLMLLVQRRSNRS